MFWVLSLAFWVLDFALVRASARITQDSKPKTLNSQAGRPSRFLGDPAGGLLVEQSQVLMNCVHDVAQVRVGHVPRDSIKKLFYVIIKARGQRADSCDFVQRAFANRLIFRDQGAGQVQPDL